MKFKLPLYKKPDFHLPKFLEYPNITLHRVEKIGVAPDYFHATTIFPEYYKLNNRWILLAPSRMDCVVVALDNEQLEASFLNSIPFFIKFICSRFCSIPPCNRVGGYSLFE